MLIALAKFYIYPHNNTLCGTNRQLKILHFHNYFYKFIIHIDLLYYEYLIIQLNCSLEDQTFLRVLKLCVTIVNYLEDKKSNQLRNETHLLKRKNILDKRNMFGGFY